MLPTIDTERFPIVRITYPAMLTEADVDEYTARLGEVLRRGKVGTVVDIRPLKPGTVGAADRQYLAAAVDDMTRAHPGRVVVEAIVMDSAILRGLYTAYCWIRKDASYQSRAFRDLADAEAWVREVLEAQGVLGVSGGGER